MSRFTRTHCPVCHTPYPPRANACQSCGKRREPFTPLELLIEELPEGIQLTHRLADSAHPVYCIAFSPDGATLASACYDQTIRLWDVLTGILLKTFPAHVREADSTSWGLCSVAFSPDGKTLVSGGFDHTVQLWDAHTGGHLQTLQGHTDGVNWASFSPDGKTLASASQDQTTRLWDTQTGELKNTLTGHTKTVSTVVFSPDGKYIASGSIDKTIRLWDTQTGDLLHSLSERNNDSYDGLAFSPDGTLLASGSNCQFSSKGGIASVVTLWDAATGEVRTRFQRDRKAYETLTLAGLAFSPDGQVLATQEKYAKEGGVRLWQVETGQQVAHIHGVRPSNSLTNLTFHPHLPLLATIGSLPLAKDRYRYNCDYEIHLYTLDTGLLLGKGL